MPAIWFPTLFYLEIHQVQVFSWLKPDWHIGQKTKAKSETIDPGDIMMKHIFIFHMKNINLTMLFQNY